MGRPTKLNDAVQAQIVAYILTGAYDYIAAEASGIDHATFKRWMAWGDGVQRGRERFRAFRAQVLQARAQVRATVEAEVRRAKPDVWLKCGPGRSKPGRDGWTEQVEVTGAGVKPLKILIGWDGDDDPKSETKMEGAALT